MCQFLIGKVQRESKMSKKYEIKICSWCQFLIGKVQQSGIFQNLLVEFDFIMCQFLIGKVQHIWWQILKKFNMPLCVNSS